MPDINDNDATEKSEDTATVAGIEFSDDGKDMALDWLRQNNDVSEDDNINWRDIFDNAPDIPDYVELSEKAAEISETLAGLRSKRGKQRDNETIEEHEAELANIKSTLDKIDFIIDATDITDSKELIRFGIDALDEWQDAAEEVMKKCDADGAFVSSLSIAEAEIVEIIESGNEEFGLEEAKKGLGKAWHDLKGTFNKASSALFVSQEVKEQKASEERRRFEEEQREQVLKTRAFLAEMHEALRVFPRIEAAINQLGASRVEAYGNICTVIGAGIELVRRLDENDIAEAVKKYKDNETTENHSALQDLLFIKNILQRRIMHIMAILVHNEVCQVSLLNVRTMASQMHEDLKGYVDEAETVWKTQHAQAGLSMMAYRLSEMRSDTNNSARKIAQELSQIRKEMQALENDQSDDSDARMNILKARLKRCMQRQEQISKYNETLQGDETRVVSEYTKLSDSVGNTMLAIAEQRNRNLALEDNSKNEVDNDDAQKTKPKKRIVKSRPASPPSGPK